MKKVLFLFIQIFIFNIALQAQKWVELGTGTNALTTGFINIGNILVYNVWRES